MIIRALEKDDASLLHQLVKKNLEHIRDYFPKTALAASSTAKAREIVIDFVKRSKKNEVFVFFIEEAGIPVGLFFAKEIDFQHSKCEIAYFTDEHCQGKGIASTGVSALIHFIFEKLELNKICCRISTDNFASIKVAEKNNFVLEGVLKKEFRISSGKFIDINCYGLLKHEPKE